MASDASDSTQSPGSQSSNTNHGSASPPIVATREIRVRYLYDNQKKITGKRQCIKLAVPSGCETVGALRDILKKRIGNDDDYFMWWSSNNDQVSSYEGDDLDDTVNILKSSAKKPLVIEITPFALYFQFNGRDMAVDATDPTARLSSLYSELDKLYPNFKCGPLPGMGDLM